MEADDNTGSLEACHVVFNRGGTAVGGGREVRERRERGTDIHKVNPVQDTYLGFLTSFKSRS